MNWSKINFGTNKKVLNITLPQIMFIEPDWFYTQYEYKDSFLAAWKECEEDETRYCFATEQDSRVDAEKNFNSYLALEKARMNGDCLPAGYVPQTHFWLIDNEEFVGEVSMRHRLTDSLTKYGGHIGYAIRPTKRRMGYGTVILRLALDEAKKFGFDKALITCDITNIGSQKVIQANGGVLENIISNPNGPDKMRWWIVL